MASKPPPSIAPGVPTGGSGKYIAIAILLFLGLGGLAYCKLTQKGPADIHETVDAGLPPAKPSGRLPDDDIPPPPAIEDAGADTGPKTLITQANSNGCEVKKCSGLASSDLETALGVRARQAHRCYDTALATDPTLKGKVSIAVRIGTNGQTCSAGVGSNELSNPAVASCMAGYFRGQSFPAPRGGCLDVNVPINLLAGR